MQALWSTILTRTSLIGSPLLIAFVLGVGSFFIYTQHSKLSSLEEKIVAQQEFTASTTHALAESIQLIEKNLIETKTLNQNLSQNLSEEQQTLALLTQDLQKVTGTVGALDKLRRIDPELLQKYSKVYFLNEHYVPSGLSDIDPKYLYDQKTTKKFHTNVLHHLTAMLEDAKLAGVNIYIKSGYRSYAEQATIKTTYSVIYGTGSNKFSADQGYSEHQLGTTVDLITDNMRGELTGFEKTPAYTWLIENAWKYGFILSYPKGNTYYIFEPWHWRYVGVGLAMKLHQENVGFYDMDQRAIDETLLNFFD
jgi:LAS superfamily LD-carboxypeptidase LdcB